MKLSGIEVGDGANILTPDRRQGLERLKELEIENKRLKKPLAEAQLDKEILKEALEGNY